MRDAASHEIFKLAVPLVMRCAPTTSPSVSTGFKKPATGSMASLRSGRPDRTLRKSSASSRARPTNT